ncbi:1301_t:CDS:1 [Dentiscutata erythropus]|uniref:1301_t:CDS:1 n=1 Tax=Dentiscutata erythropus TaxID=1348616 RepID=A0A9N9AJK3_9GLOM|nr:1301_t:CDS:1 [Dentiscutata erythropus]
MARRKKKNKYCTNEECRKNLYGQGDCKDTSVIGIKKYHRVFGKWKCNRCRKQWISGYIWILLQKFNNNIPASELNYEDYYQQECKKCHSEINELIEWRPLEITKKVSKRPHEEELCAKCQIGIKCQEANDYRSFFY